MNKHDRIFSILFVSIAVFVFGFTLYQALIAAKTKNPPESAQQKAQIQEIIPEPKEEESSPVDNLEGDAVEATSTTVNATSNEPFDVLLLEENQIPEKKMVKIKDTPTGWLNMRDGPGISYAQIKRVNPGEMYELLDEQFGWYQIQLDEKTTGWITSLYADKK